MRLRKFTFWIFAFLHLSCVSSFMGPSQNYDSHKIKVQILSLFNQREKPKDSNKNWKGDWIFRRERLALIDRELGEIKPDLIIFQDAMERGSNIFESDQKILSEGSLKGYRWSGSKIKEFSDTGEAEYLTLALNPPLNFAEEKTSTIIANGTSVLAMDVLTLGNQKILVVNLKFDSSLSDAEFENLLDSIHKKLSLENICRERLLIAAYVPSEIHGKIADILSSFDLQDSSKGFCNTEAKCHTISANNQIFYQSYGEFLPARVDFLLVPNTARIKISEVNFTEAKPSTLGYFKQFGLNALWASDRYGWKSELTLAQCHAL